MEHAPRGFMRDSRDVFFTTDIRDAARFRDFADEAAKKAIDRKLLRVSPWAGRIPTRPGLRPLPHQKPALRFILARNRSYLWADMGTGKGPMSAMMINALASKGPVFVCFVTPPELVYNVETELKKWLVRDPDIRIYKKGMEQDPLYQVNEPWRICDIQVLIMPDTMLGKCDARYLIPDSGRKNLLIVDEADRFKTPTSQRTENLLGFEVKGEGPQPGFADNFDRILYMSGTALPNGCALELFPVLNHSAPETIGFLDYYRFAFRYCESMNDGFGWKFKGIKNEETWHALLRPFVYRLDKSVLKLPKRIESALVVASDMKPKLAELDRRLRKYAPEDLMKKIIHASRGGKKGEEDELHLMTYRRLLGREKALAVIPYIKKELETGSILIGALHIEVVDLLREKLAKFDPVVIDGRVPKKKRHELLQEFLRDKRHRPVIANQAAMRRGFTILKCRRVLHVEFDWVPGNNDQFSDRTHRVGQTEDVYIQYAIFRNSVDLGVLETILRKRKNTQKLENKL